MVLKDPRGNVLYQGQKKQYDSHVWTADQTGVYMFCFSNKFSTFSHKLVYFDIQVGDEQPLPGTGEHQTAMTKVGERRSRSKNHSEPFAIKMINLFSLSLHRKLVDFLTKRSSKVWTTFIRR